MTVLTVIQISQGLGCCELQRRQATFFCRGRLAFVRSLCSTKECCHALKPQQKQSTGSHLYSLLNL